MAKLIIIEGPDNGNEHELDVRNGSLIFTSGRDPLTEIPLNDSAISRRPNADDRLDPGRNGDRKGARFSRDSLLESKTGTPLRGTQLRGSPREPGRERAFRP